MKLINKIILNFIVWKHKKFLLSILNDHSRFFYSNKITAIKALGKMIHRNIGKLRQRKEAIDSLILKNKNKINHKDFDKNIKKYY